MVGFLIILLIISQLICFYFIILLNMKVSKFKDLEKRQDQLIREMDDTIGLYLFEMKEENDRFISELSSVKQSELKQDEIIKSVAMMKLEEEEEISSPLSPNNNSIDSVQEPILEAKSYIPKSIVKSAYNQQKKKKNDPYQNLAQQKESRPQKDIAILPSFEQKVLHLHQDGKTIDEIAKITQKGKTEIELLIKFHA